MANRTCWTCAKSVPEAEMTHAMPSVFPDSHPTEFACSLKCYQEWQARSGVPA